MTANSTDPAAAPTAQARVAPAATMQANEGAPDRSRVWPGMGLFDMPAIRTMVTPAALPAAALFDALTADTPEAAGLCNTAGKLLIANAALAAIAGRRLDPGMPVDQLFDLEHHPAVAQLLTAAHVGRVRGTLVALGGAAWQVQLEPIGADLRLFRVLSQPAQRELGWGTAAGAGDAHLRAQFGGIVHDLNNLLAAILSGVDVLREMGLPPAAVETLLGLEVAAHHGVRLARQALGPAATSPPSGALVLDDGLRALVPMLRRILGASVRLDLQLHAGDATAALDHVQLGRIVLNLAVNACAAMPVTGILTVRSWQAEAEVGFAVQDTGPGIPAELLPQLFMPYVSTRRTAGGSGLGLNVVQQIVRQAGGQVTADNIPGQGARFQITLPRCRPTTRRTRPGATRGEAILVEDETLVSRYFQNLLAKSGFTPRHAATGAAALAWLHAATRPALLITDLALPDQDGLALADQFRARWPDLPVILTSGYVDPKLRANLATRGMAFLPKPSSAADVEAVLADIETAPAAGVAFNRGLVGMGCDQEGACPGSA